ncbi:M10 family metallopeptidase C-terminal domain-containing protein [Brevundimonas sp.]|uniref:M10 family metallopeptidase C-terminal domain-containing protein n=1 Tax=Brevundimonas sp. TaxID=1871086 RepID=UPI002FC818C2
MFDSFSRSFGSTSSRLVESDRSGTADPTLDPSFGAIASYQICGCCGGFHAVTDGTDGGGQGLILNADDRGVFGPNGKPSLDPIDAGAQITRSNLSWAPGLGQAAVVTFAFRDTFVTSLPADTSGHTSFSAAQISATLLALAAWSEVANITFQRVTDGGTEYSENATILFGNYSSGQSGAAAFAYLPGSTAAGAVQGDVWINNSLSYNATPVMQGYGQQVLLHEIGHAIGLSHPAAYNASADGVITYAGNATYFEDSRQYTVMSYFSERETGADFRSGGANRYSAVPLLDDIAAAQRLYGANTTTRTGDTVYGFNSNAGQPWFSATSSSSALIFAVWDAGGTDTFNFSGYSVAQTIDLRQGAFSSVGGLIGNVAIAIGVVIENVVGGTGVDSIRGNSASNVITGNGGNDEIDGGLGSDTVVFSGARSSYTITWNGQVGTVTGLGATVTVSNVEFLQFSDTTIAAAPTGGLLVGGDITNETINGTAFGDTIGGLGGNDTIHGMAGADTLDGGSGDDVLNGGDNDDLLIGGRGDDALNGGAGHDVADYAGAGAGVTVNLATGLASGGAGTDTLSGIEELRGTAYADTLTGDGAANVLRGGGGIDTLNGGGGADQLFAGTPGEGGGAPDIIKPSGTANDSIANAVSLAGGFDLGTRADVANSTTIPHATVVATSHGGMEYYAVTVAAGETVVFDIDNATFDSVLRIYDAGNVLLVQNDDSASDGGPATDSGLSYTFAAAGTYYIQVSQWQSGSDGTLVTTAPPAGGTYTLHVSVPSAPVVALDFLGATMNGEAGADILTGGVGRDALNGGADDDLLNGGAENDAIDGGAGADTAVFSGNRAAYTISTNSGVTTVTGPDGADSLTNVERLQFADGLYDITGAPLDTTIDGTQNADDLNGTTGADTINGFGGDDVIRGGLGNDTLDGGAGTDTAVFSGTIGASTISTVGGVTTVTGPDGTDSVSNVERLRFEDGTLIVGASGGQYYAGTANADVITGTAYNDEIFGNGGNDIIDGAGGVDQMWGGAGDDRYNVDHVNDVVTEAAGEGYDRILAATSYTLLGASEIEWLSTSFTAGVETISLGGNALNNLIEGNDGQNLLEGHAGNDTLVGNGGNDYLDGGLGADQMSGGLGDDFYRVDNINDFADEGAGEGYDRILASTSYTLLGASEIEWLSTSFTAGVETISLGGNALNNLIEGNNGQNLLEGHAGNDTLVGNGGNDYLDGGLGVDQMSGGLGDDSYRVDNINDFADEGAGEGYDRILASTSYTLLGASEIEWLSTSFTAGVDAIDLTGNALDNLIEGNNGVNRLDGGAGDDELLGYAGDDVLIGGGGNDRIDGGDGFDTLQLTGLAADYTIVAQNGGYRITDNVAGRDGVILMTTVESIRFGDGSTLPMAAPVAPEKAGADALVLPGAGGDAKAAEAGPQVLPTVVDDTPQILPVLGDAKGSQDGTPVSPGEGDVPLVIPGPDDFLFEQYDETPLVLPDESDSFQWNPDGDLFERPVIDLAVMDGAHSLHLLPSDEPADTVRPHDPWA